MTEGLTPLGDVQRYVLDAVGVLPAAPVPIIEAVGLVTAADVTATDPVPPFANSAMDGYAVRSPDCVGASDATPVRLRVAGEIRAGAAPDTPVGPGEAVRIMTGAPVPDGADGIVIVEHTELDGDDVVVRRPAGEHIRAAGSDFNAGDVVVPAGTSLGPAHVGVLASAGLDEVDVHRRPRVAVLATGDELVGPGTPLRPGQIRESNRPMLVSLVAAAGCEPVDCGIVADDQSALRTALEEAIGSCDAVVTSGGVSVGDYDFVKSVLGEIADMRWFQVAIKPAKPFAFGVARGDDTPVPVFGLPGNPVSSFVSFELFARPALRRMTGCADLFRPVVEAVAGAELRRRRDGKTHFDRVVVTVDDDGRLCATPAGAQQSHVLTAMARANGLAVLADGEGLAKGQPVEVLLLELPAGAVGARGGAAGAPPP